MRYRHLEFSASSPAPTPKEISAIEALLGAPLPQDFKDFLKAANGATLPYSINVCTEEVDDSLNFRTIFSTVGDDEDTFLGEIVSLRQRWQIPNGVLPFARDYGGSVVFLDLRPQGQGAVIARLDGCHGGTGVMREPPFVRVADSFADYIEKLAPELSDEAFGC
jgi:cell wall assembly regulator SMI1